MGLPSAAGLLLLVSALITAQASAQVQPFTPDQRQALASLVSDWPTAGAEVDASLWLRKVFLQAATLQILQRPAVVPQAETCRVATRALGSEQLSLEAGYYAAQLLGVAGCTAPSNSSKAAAGLALASLGSSGAVADWFHATGLITALQAMGAHPGLSRQQADDVTARLHKLVEPKSGVLRAGAGKPASMATTGRALSILADLQAVAGSPAQQAATEIVAAVVKGLGRASYGGAAADDLDKLEAAALLLQGLARVPSQPNPLKLGELARLLLDNLEVGTLEDAYHVMVGLDALSSMPNAPLFITSLQPFVPAFAQAWVRVRVADAVGKPVHGCHVTMLQLAPASNGKPVAGKAAMVEVEGEAGVYAWQLPAATEPGLYRVSVEAVVKDAVSPAAHAELVLAVQAKLSVSELRLELEDAVGREVHRLALPAAGQGAAAAAPISLAQAQQLKVSFGLKAGDQPAVAQQVVVCILGKRSGDYAFVPAQPDKTKRQYTAVLSASAIEKQLGTKDRRFQATLLVGDIAADAALSIPFPDLLLPQSGQEPAKLPSGLAKPEIVHQFRQPDKRPPVAVAVLFTGLAVTPWIVLLGALKVVQPSMKGFPTTRRQVLAATGFHGGIVLIIGLYTLFWLHLNLLQTLPVLGLLGLGTAVAGHTLLQGSANARLKAA